MKKQLFLVTALALATLASGNASHAAAMSQVPSFQGIIGGTEVTGSDPIASTTVMIFGEQTMNTQDGPKVGHFICSGSIIDKDLILTAAHCVGEDGLAKVVAVFRTNMDGQGPVIPVVDRRRPSDFMDRAQSGDKDWHDLAVLRLAKPIPAGYGIAKILSDRSALKTNGSVTLAGYGINVPVSSGDQNSNDGAGILRKVDQTVLNPAYGSTEFLVSLKDKGSCHGDSGGPAFIKKGSDYYLVGVDSRMTENDRVANNNDQNDFSCSTDMVYTNIISKDSAAWINNAINELHSGF